MSSIYAGPAKVYRAADVIVVGGVTASASARAFQAEGENGAVKIAINEATNEIATAMQGKLGEKALDQVGEISFKPFDDWDSLDQLFPPWIGASVGATTASLQIGGRPFGVHGGYTATKVWTQDGRLYNAIRSAVTGHPTLHLGVDKALYGDAKISFLWDETIAMGTAPATNFMAITESAASDPGGQMNMTHFTREAWTGAWGAVTGFTGMETEDEWTVETQVKYTFLKKQARTLTAKLDSCQFMVKGRLYGPTHTQILTNVGAHTSGQNLGAHDLILTGSSTGSIITLKNAEVKGAGYDFGGTKLGTDEVGFVNLMTFSAGVAQPLITFSTYGNV